MSNFEKSFSTIVKISTYVAPGTNVMILKYSSKYEGCKKDHNIGFQDKRNFFRVK
jgi:hypothetical protein